MKGFYIGSETETTDYNNQVSIASGFSQEDGQSGWALPIENASVPNQWAVPLCPGFESTMTLIEELSNSWYA